jgi:hypothetical protein
VNGLPFRLAGIAGREAARGDAGGGHNKGWREHLDECCPHGSKGVTVAGNVALGRVHGVEAGVFAGGGLADFEAVTWDGER